MALYNESAVVTFQLYPVGMFVYLVYVFEPLGLSLGGHISSKQTFWVVTLSIVFHSESINVWCVNSFMIFLKFIFLTWICLLFGWMFHYWKYFLFCVTALVITLSLSCKVTSHHAAPSQPPGKPTLTSMCWTVMQKNMSALTGYASHKSMLTLSSIIIYLVSIHMKTVNFYPNIT